MPFSFLRPLTACRRALSQLRAACARRASPIPPERIELATLIRGFQPPDTPMTDSLTPKPEPEPTASTLRQRVGPSLDSLDLGALRRANIAREAEWCPDQIPDLSFRGNELAGETGEACNIIKKLERERLGWRGSRSTKEKLAEELADVVICADLAAMAAGVELAPAVVAKFNATTDANGLKTRVEPPAFVTDEDNCEPRHAYRSACVILEGLGYRYERIGDYRDWRITEQGMRKRVRRARAVQALEAAGWRYMGGAWIEPPPQGEGKSADDVAGEAYQVIGELAALAGFRWGHPEVVRALNYFGRQEWKKPGVEILPFALPEDEKGPAPETGRTPRDALDRIAKALGIPASEFLRGTIEAFPEPAPGVADNLRDAIAFALSSENPDGLEWLRDWDQGDPVAAEELELWRQRVAS